MRWKKTYTYILLAIFLIRLSLPIFFTEYVNSVIGDIQGYSGNVEHMGLSLFRGAYQFENIKLSKHQGGQKYPLFKAKEIDVSIHWLSLLKGRLVAEIFLYDFFVDIDAGPRSEANAKENIEEIKKTDETMWLKSLRALVPLRINVIALVEGEVIIAKGERVNEVIFSFDHLDGSFSNLRNVDQQSPSDFSLTGKVLKEGDLSIKGVMDLHKTYPQYDYAVDIQSLPLNNLNYFARKYAYLDFEAGMLDIHGKLKTEGKEIKGYIEPVLRNVKVMEIKSEDGIINNIWQSVVAGFLSLFETGEKEIIKTKVEISGMRKDPEINAIGAFGTVVYNALVNIFD